MAAELISQRRINLFRKRIGSSANSFLQHGLDSFYNPELTDAQIQAGLAQLHSNMLSTAVDSINGIQRVRNPREAAGLLETLTRDLPIKTQDDRTMDIRVEVTASLCVIEVTPLSSSQQFKPYKTEAILVTQSINDNIGESDEIDRLFSNEVTYLVAPDFVQKPDRREKRKPFVLYPLDVAGIESFIGANGNEPEQIGLNNKDSKSFGVLFLPGESI